MKREKIGAFSIVLLLVAVFLVPSASAATSDTFTVTVTGEYIVIAVDETDWDVHNGTSITMDDFYNSSHDGHLFVGDCSDSSVALDIKGQITSDDGPDWSSAGDGEGAQEDKYVLNATAVGFSGSEQLITASSQTFISDLTQGVDAHWNLTFQAPSATTSGAQQQFTVTITAAKH